MEDASMQDAPDASSAAPQEPAAEELPSTTVAPQEALSTSALSPAPDTDAVEAADPPAPTTKPDEVADVAASPFREPQLSAQTESVVKRINDDAASAAASGTPGWEAAREQVMRDMQTSDQFTAPASPKSTDKPKLDDNAASADIKVDVPSQLTVEGASNQPSMPASATPTTVSRGRGGGRPRGRGRGGARRGSKRKREKSDDESEDSEVYSPAVTTTKSGRSVQKPTSFVPPPASPTTSSKKKRPYRKNPESAVCKVCLRGTSPANNMIVFCDGCNTPYHRFCHHPLIDQAVIDEVDKEWYCKQCEDARTAVLPESEIAHFISAEGAPVEQRQRYFASLAPGMLVTLLLKATSLKPDLPLFPPDFRARLGSAMTTSAPAPAPVNRAHNSKGHSHPQSASNQVLTAPDTAAYTTAYPMQYNSSHAVAGASDPRNQAQLQSQPQHYIHQQQYATHNYGPEVHPPNYPRPGHGLMRTLPAGQEDLQWLVDEDDRFGVFSHMYQVNPAQANAGGMARPPQ